MKNNWLYIFIFGALILAPQLVTCMCALKSPFIETMLPLASFLIFIFSIAKMNSAKKKWITLILSSIIFASLYSVYDGTRHSSSFPLVLLSESGKKAAIATREHEQEVEEYRQVELEFLEEETE